MVQDSHHKPGPTVVAHLDGRMRERCSNCVPSAHSKRLANTEAPASLSFKKTLSLRSLPNCSSGDTTLDKLAQDVIFIRLWRQLTKQFSLLGPRINWWRETSTIPKPLKKAQSQSDPRTVVASFLVRPTSHFNGHFQNMRSWQIHRVLAGLSLHGYLWGQNHHLDALSFKIEGTGEATKRWSVSSCTCPCWARLTTSTIPSKIGGTGKSRKKLVGLSLHAFQRVNCLFQNLRHSTVRCCSLSHGLTVSCNIRDTGTCSTVRCCTRSNGLTVSFKHRDTDTCSTVRCCTVALVQKSRQPVVALVHAGPTCPPRLSFPTPEVPSPRK